MTSQWHERRRQVVRQDAMDVTLPDGTQFHRDAQTSALDNKAARAVASLPDRALVVRCDAGVVFCAVAQQAVAQQDDQDVATFAVNVRIPRFEFEAESDPLTLPCVCGTTHVVDLKRLWALVDQRRGLAPKARTARADEVVPSTSG